MTDRVKKVFRWFAGLVVGVGTVVGLIVDFGDLLARLQRQGIAIGLPKFNFAIEQPLFSFLPALFQETLIVMLLIVAATLGVGAAPAYWKLVEIRRPYWDVGHDERRIRFTGYIIAFLGVFIMIMAAGILMNWLFSPEVLR